MRTSGAFRWSQWRWVAGLVAVVVGPYIFLSGGCTGPCFENFGFVPWVDVRGTVLDEATGTPLAGVDIGIVLYDRNGDLLLSMVPNGIRHPEMFLTKADGSFQITSDRSTVCITVLGATVSIPLPVVDRLEVVVLREGCESRFSFDVNESNIVDPSAPDGLLELKDPILVPPCVE